MVNYTVRHMEMNNWLNSERKTTNWWTIWMIGIMLIIIIGLILRMGFHIRLF
jgi:hypothetical protein